MKCIIKEENNKSDHSTVIVRRKFVPINFLIQRENQFLNAGTKLPFTTSKVIGLLTTSEIEKTCSDTPLTPKYYFGITDSQMEDSSFLELTEGIEYTETYAPDIRLQAEYDGWWYFAHPATDRLPLYQESGSLEPLDDYKEIGIQFEGQCDPDAYFLWSGFFTGDLWITFEEYT